MNLIAPISLFLCSSALYAQGGGTWTLHNGVHGNPNAPLRAEAISSAGDVDGDGRADILVGNPFGPYPGAGVRGVAHVYSGANGMELLQIFNPGNGADALGKAVSAVGDVDSDGHDDFLVGAPARFGSRGTAALYSGADGRVIFEFEGAGYGSNLGAAVLGIHDFNQDGVADMLVSEPFVASSWPNTSGQVHLYSGADGTELATIDAPIGTIGFGITLGRAGDLDHDGTDEVLILGLSYGRSVISAYSVVTGAALIQMEAPLSGYGAIRAITSAGDLNLDGIDDVLVGVPFSDPEGAYRNGAVHIFSGADGSLMRIVDGPAGNGQFGQSLVGNVDVNRDGYPDYFVGKPYGANPKVYVHSGKDDSLIDVLQGAANSTFGMTMHRVGDTDYDSYSEIAIAAPYADALGHSNVGSVMLLDFDR